MGISYAEKSELIKDDVPLIRRYVFFALLRPTQQKVDTLFCMAITYFKNNIRQLREEKGFTQQQVAEWLGVDRSQICRYETGEQTPRIDTLKILAVHFGVSVEEIMGEKRKYDLDSEGNPMIDFSGGQVVSSQLFSQANTNSLTIYTDGIKFSTGCVRKWNDEVADKAYHRVASQAEFDAF